MSKPVSPVADIALAAIRLVAAHPAVIHPASPLPKLRLDYLDGLRALAALYVVLSHIYMCCAGLNSRDGVSGLLTNWLLYGHLAVDVFIVLSGFCLMMPVAQSGQLKGGTLDFYRRRCRRILPPLYAALGVFILLHSGQRYLQEHHLVLPSGRTLLANLLLLQDFLPRLNTIDIVSWSVAAEWKIYLLFPVFVWVWQRWGLLSLLATGAALGLIATVGTHGFAPHMDLTRTCPWYLFLFSLGAGGAALVFTPAQSRPRHLGPLALAVLAVLIGLLLRFPITAQGEAPLFDPHLALIDPVAGLLTTLVLMRLALPLAKPSAWLLALSWRPLVFIGSFSYSVYLIHFALIGLAFRLADHLVPHLGSGTQVLARTAVALPLILGAAYLFHLAFERPFMSRPGRPAPRTERQAEVAAIVSPAP